MMSAVHILLCIFIVFTALGLASAVMIGRHRPPPADPYSSPFGDGPHFCRDLQRVYSREQLEAIARRPVVSDRLASRSDAGARRFVPSGPAGARATGGRDA